MSMIKQEITTENSKWLLGSQAQVEGILKLPDVLEEISNILEITGQGEASEISCAEDRIVVEAVGRFSVLYLDKKGDISSFDAETRFQHVVSQNGIAAEMQALCTVVSKDISFQLVDSSSVSIRAIFDLDIYALANAEYEILEAYSGDKNQEIQAGQMEIPRIDSAKCVKSFVKTELRVPQSMPPVRQILTVRGYALVKNMHTEDGKVIVEGDLRVFIVYQSPDKNAPLQFFNETIPFGEIIPDDRCGVNSQLFASSSLDRIAADLVSEDQDLIGVSAVINLCTTSRSTRQIDYIEDLYDRRQEARLKTLPIQIGACREFECQKKIVRLSLEIPEGAPEVVRVLYTSAFPEIVAAKPDRDRVGLEGVMRFWLCYTTADAGIKSIKVAVPFETEVSLPELSENADIFAKAFAEYASTEGSGRELEAKCCLDIWLCEMARQSVCAVSEVELVPADPVEPGIVVYFADGKETLWDIAKRFKVKQDMLKGMEGGSRDVVPKGKKLILVRN